MELEQSQRIHVVDSLRGFALLGILFIHIFMYFLAGPFLPDLQEMAVQNWLDEALRSGIYWFALSKFYSIFSMLFGLGFAIQLRNAEKKGANFRMRFLWRMAILAAFGFAHWIIYPGDILVLYAVIGVLLIPLSYLNTRVLLVMAVLLFVGLGRGLFFALDADKTLFTYDWMAIYSGFMSAVFEGSFWETAQASYARMIIFWNEQLSIWGRFYNTLAYFIFGMLLGRAGWLADLDTHIGKFRVACVLGLIGAVVFGTIHVLYIGDAWELFYGNHQIWLIVAQYGAFDLYSFALSAFYASGFVLLAYHFPTARMIGWLGAYGRMALTSFVMQSLLGTFAFFNWGLGLIKVLTVSESFIVFLAIAVFQLVFANLWLKHFPYGPLEWLWRSLTYLEWVPNGRKPALA